MAECKVPIIIDWDSIKDRLAEGNIVEVVRCEECKHLTNDRICPRWGRICELTGGGKEENGFCDEGERKVNDERV